MMEMWWKWTVVVQLVFALLFVWAVFPLGEGTPVLQGVFATGVPLASVIAAVIGCMRRSLRAVSVFFASAFGLACYLSMWIGRALLFVEDELEGGFVSALTYSLGKVAGFVQKSFSVSAEHGLKLLVFELASPVVLFLLFAAGSIALAGRYREKKGGAVKT